MCRGVANNMTQCSEVRGVAGFLKNCALLKSVAMNARAARSVVRVAARRQMVCCRHHRLRCALSLHSCLSGALRRGAVGQVGRVICSGSGYFYFLILPRLFIHFKPNN